MTFDTDTGQGIDNDIVICQNSQVKLEIKDEFLSSADEADPLTTGPFSCNDCDQAFAQREHLFEHMNLHHI